MLSIYVKIMTVISMNFDLFLFENVGSLLKDEINKSTINKVLQISKSSFCLQLYKNNKTTYFTIILNPNLSHFSLNSEYYYPTIPPSNLAKYLQREIQGGIINDFILIENERILKLVIEKTSYIGTTNIRHLYIELTGRMTNLILTKEDDIILDAYNKYAFDEGFQRMVAGGISYRLPPQNKDFKLSKLLEEEQKYRNISKEEILKLVKKSNDIYLYPKTYHLVELSHLKKESTKMPILDGLNHFYKKVLQKNTYLEVLNPIKKIINNEKKRLLKRIDVLNDNLKSSEDAYKYKYWGDLIFTYGHKHLNQKLPSLTLYDEAENKEVNISLNEKQYVKTNASRFYARYKKLLLAKDPINEQINKRHEELDYFKNIEEQLQYDLNINDLLEIKEELENQKVIKKQVVIKKQPKQQKFNLTAYKSNDGVLIYVGKNNVQNDYLTFRFAKKDDLFFHVKDIPGAHVIVKHSPNIKEDTIRLAAKIAAYYSRARNSSSVPINYTSVSNVRKIKGQALGSVRFSEHKTIYIDVDEDLNKYLLKKQG